MLYASDVYEHVYQYDLTAPNLDSSRVTVAVWDSTYDKRGKGILFYIPFQGYDGKLYYVSSSQYGYYHQIEHPDTRGVGCNLRQRFISIPDRYIIGTTPNNPYYGLGPVKGSQCDSLRVDQPQLQYHNFDLRAAPNPVLHGHVTFYFELPQVRSGTLSLYNTLGQEVASYYVAPGSGILSATLPTGTDSGIYTAIIRSQGYQKAKPIAVVNPTQ